MMLVKVSDVISGTKVQPRPYQKRIVGKIVDMFRGRYKSGDGSLEPFARSVMVESPTGSGKTVMAWLGAKALQMELAGEGEKLAIGWVAMRRNLLKQAAMENAQYCAISNPKGKNIGVVDVHMISMFDKFPAELVEKKRAGYKVLLVMDEAQHDAAASAAHLHNTIEPDWTLGLSATPFRTDRVKLCFDKVIKDAGIHQLIQDGYLSKYHHYSIPNWNVRTVVDAYLREPARWGKSIFYFKNLFECFECGSLLRAAGVVCEVVTGDSDVDSQLALFEKGDVPVLINCMKLTEGFDSPDLQTAFVRDSGKGCTMQMGGRAFRKHERIPVKQIVQGRQTRWPMIRTAMPEQQYVWQEDRWLSLTVNPMLNNINQNCRRAIAQANVELPNYLTSKAAKKTRKLRFS